LDVTGQEIVNAVMAKHRVGPKDFFGPSRFAHVVAARRAATLRLQADGMRVPMIARVMRRDRSSVRYWLRPDYREHRLIYRAQRRFELQQVQA
jgi:hypothetical protein